jgi:uncharacterized membrane protein
MNFSNDARDKIQPGLPVRDPLHILALAIVALQILIAVCAFPFLPHVVPTHWNATGQVDGYAPRLVNTILFPLVSIGLYLLLRFVAASPRPGGSGGAVANARMRTTLLVAVLLFMLIVQLCVTAISLGMSINMPFVLNLALSVLFIVIGNFLGKTRRNFWLGIRTPWTLSSEQVWERTHRLGGWLFVAIGLLGIPCSFWPPLRPWGLVGLLILASLFLYGYSYRCYQQIAQEGREPLSPPFQDEEG